MARRRSATPLRNYDVDSDLYGVLARAGYQSGSFWGAEVEGTLGVSDETATVTTLAGPVETSAKVKNSLAGFALARAPITQKINLLGRVGYHNTEFDSSMTDGAGVVTSTDSSVDGVAYGVGAEYAFSPKTSIRADYTIYDYDGPNADAVSLALSRKF